jgi:hypothetical protein
VGPRAVLDAVSTYETHFWLVLFFMNSMLVTRSRVVDKMTDYELDDSSSITGRYRDVFSPV